LHLGRADFGFGFGWRLFFSWFRDLEAGFLFFFWLLIDLATGLVFYFILFFICNIRVSPSIAKYHASTSNTQSLSVVPVLGGRNVTFMRRSTGPEIAVYVPFLGSYQLAANLPEATSFVVSAMNGTPLGLYTASHFPPESLVPLTRSTLSQSYEVTID
jgi:hypothetical protein